VALPMDEQRILEEMERMLAADDPRLASKLAAFGQPGVGQVLKTRRARAVLSLLLLAVIAAAAAVIYMMSAFRIGQNLPASHGSRTTSSAGPRSQAWPVIRPPVPLSGSSYCIFMLTPRTCTAWSSQRTGSHELSGGSGLVR
jgi:hypothetical protein